MNPNLKAFLKGFASILNVSGTAYKFRPEFTRNDEEAVRKDWERVNEDFCQAMAKEVQKGKN